MAKKKADSKVALEIPVIDTRDTAELQEQMIAVAAYFRAEQRGFSPGQEVDDWLQAEKEIASRATGRGSGA
ncbi:MAG: DUF2934 domain-containing protein [Betaproteobacteria bacterium]|nr:DUF2934 domain-containing protein [Betaproteobacteria bacterium]